jgi:acetylornithine deacetylase/succinyl-diaminopimelate desuccinylase-like protein
MTRDTAIQAVQTYYDSGQFLEELSRRVAFQTESPNPEKHEELSRYLTDELTPELTGMGFDTELFDNPDPDAGPLLVAKRQEATSLPTVMSYAHGDVTD